MTMELCNICHAHPITIVDPDRIRCAWCIVHNYVWCGNSEGWTSDEYAMAFEETEDASTMAPTTLVIETRRVYGDPMWEELTSHPAACKGISHKHVIRNRYDGSVWMYKSGYQGSGELTSRRVASAFPIIRDMTPDVMECDTLWCADCSDHGSIIRMYDGDRYTEARDYSDPIVNDMVSLATDITMTWLFDRYINNGDRHTGNWLVDSVGQRIVLIDNGFGDDSRPLTFARNGEKRRDGTWAEVPYMTSLILASDHGYRFAHHIDHDDVLALQDVLLRAATDTDDPDIQEYILDAAEMIVYIIAVYIVNTRGDVAGSWWSDVAHEAIAKGLTVHIF